MENTARLGPLPTDPVPAALSGSRRALLELLHQRAEPATLAELVRLTGLHENTVRGHLDGLAADRLVRREQATPDGRGRPAWLWSAAPAAQHSEYAGLASTLASTLNHTSTDPARDARVAGEDWGRELAADRSRSAPGGAPGSARQRVTGLLGDLGFAPQDRAEGGVRLTRCPLLEAARRYPEIVCQVHQGLVTGALETYGDRTATAELQPFAEPGACLLFLRDGAPT